MLVAVRRVPFFNRFPTTLATLATPAVAAAATIPSAPSFNPSPSTARNDRLEKRFAYLSLPSLQLYLLVESRRRGVTGYYREAAGWRERRFGLEEAIPVPCIGASLNFGELYDKTLL